MEGRESTAGAAQSDRAGRLGSKAPGPADLLRAALEKIVFFEWRLSELTAELAAAQSRTAAAEADRQRAHDEALAAARESQAARLRAVEMEADRARLASLLAQPAHAQIADEAALQAERDRSAELSAELQAARHELERQKSERARWLQEMIEQARQGDEAPAALAQFISELRSEVLALRTRQRQCDELLIGAGIAPPQTATIEPLPQPPAHEHDAVAQARKLWAEGRIGGEVSSAPSLATDWSAAPPASSRSGLASGPPPGLSPHPTDLLPGLAALQRAPAATVPALPRSQASIPAAQRALAEQCLRGLASSDAARRTQAARHLDALPVAAAAPALAAALGRESDPRARAAIARALAACGGEGAAMMIGQLLLPEEPALVRLAALDSLAGMGSMHARRALELGAADPSTAVRRRVASLALAAGDCGDLVARLSVDPDASVRAAAGSEGSVPEAPLVEDELGRSRSEWDDTTQRTSHPQTPAASVLASAPTATAHPQAGRALARLAAPSDPLVQSALHAVRTAMMGLTESELAQALEVEAPRAAAVIESLLASGLLARRGRRLIVGSAEESAAGRGA